MDSIKEQWGNTSIDGHPGGKCPPLDPVHATMLIHMAGGIDMVDKSHILIVDDDPALLQALPHTLALRISGVQADTSASAQGALELIQAHDYDAIVTDIKMPGMDGLALLTQIQALRPETPTPLITGHGEHQLAIQALRGGAYDYLQKPLDRDDVVAAVQRALQTHQLRCQVKALLLSLELHAASLQRLVHKRTLHLA